MIVKTSDGFWLVVLLSLGDPYLSTLPSRDHPLSEGLQDVPPHFHTLSQLVSEQP